MKHLLLCFTLALTFANVLAQSPQLMNYQGVARDNGGNVLANQAVGVRVYIRSGSTTGTIVYQEEHAVTTNDFGLFNLQIGSEDIGGAMLVIDWAGNSHYIEIGLDPSGGTSYQTMGVSQLISVPYALHAKSAANVSGTANYVSKFSSSNQLGNSQLFDNGTNIGIGTTTPLERLHLDNGSLRINSSFGNIKFESTGGTGWQWSTQGGGVGLQLHNLVSGSTDQLRMYLDGSNGRMGLGTGTPLSPLDIRGGASSEIVRLVTNDQLQIGFYEALSYRGYVGSVAGNEEDIDLASDAGSVHLVTGGTIDLTAKAGKIGIGNTSPAATLDVNNPSTGQTIKVNATDQVYLGFWENNGYRGYVGSYYGGIADVDLGSLAGSVHLVTGSSIDLTAKAGNIGIGTTDPVQLLDIVSAGNAFARITSASNANEAGLDLMRDGGNSQWRIANDGFDNQGELVFRRESFGLTTPSREYRFSASFFQPASDNNKTLGTASNRWSVVYAGNGTINTSDGRDKENVRELGYGIADLMKLRPVSFTWKEKPQWGTKLGLIAQEVDEVIDEVVIQGNLEPIYNDAGEEIDKTDRYGIFYSDLIPVLIKATQDQQLLIEKQQAQIDALIKDNESIREELKK
ncbi:MAG: tail fiber domain-containing protein [Flavobacteriales bacterium]|nr:tail fiber domain-containing protein [Flavobacteriales bacterium]